MPGPPPPPPGPPPPPMNAMSPVKKPASSGSSDMRGALLGQIQKGTKLKKVTTVDKSTPQIAGKIAGTSESPSSSSPIKSNKSSPDSSTSSPALSRGGGQKGFMSLTDELQHKLTLKKKQQSPSKETTSKESSPPLPVQTTNNFASEIKTKQQQSVINSSYHQSKNQPLTVANNSPSLSDAISNKSSLFNTQKSQSNIITTTNIGSTKINYGKPNLAPKPPAQLSLAINNNNNISSNSSDMNRKSVARHQSMKSPRSPPIALSPSDNHFATIRPSKFEALNLQVGVQQLKPAAQRPTNKPPPPPVPTRNLVHAKSTTALNNAQSENQNLNASRLLQRMPNSGSTNNVNEDVPPQPPVRITSRTVQGNVPQVASNNQVMPPEVPKRINSMRISVENNVSNNQNSNRYPSPNLNQPVTRLVVDLEARYSLLFHSLSEFPAPKQFINIPKSYPSLAVRPTNGIN